MVRIIVERMVEPGKKYIEAAGTSEDIKPSSGIVTGSMFVEVDTGDVFAFDENTAPGGNPWRNPWSSENNNG